MNSTPSQRSESISALGRDHVLFFFFRSDCPYCHAFAPTLEAFQTRHGIRVVAISVDGAAIQWNQHFYYKACMFSNVPNYAAVFGYLNASWTLRADIVSEWVCRVLNHMQATGSDIAVPVLFLASAWSRFMTGQVLFVDGGLVMA